MPAGGPAPVPECHLTKAQRRLGATLPSTLTQRGNLSTNAINPHSRAWVIPSGTQPPHNSGLHRAPARVCTQRLYKRRTTQPTCRTKRLSLKEEGIHWLRPAGAAACWFSSTTRNSMHNPRKAQSARGQGGKAKGKAGHSASQPARALPTSAHPARVNRQASTCQPPPTGYPSALLAHLDEAAEPDDPLAVAGLCEVAVHPVQDVQPAVRTAGGASRSRDRQQLE